MWLFRWPPPHRVDYRMRYLAAYEHHARRSSTCGRTRPSRRGRRRVLMTMILLIVMMGTTLTLIRTTVPPHTSRGTNGLNTHGRERHLDPLSHVLWGSGTVTNHQHRSGTVSALLLVHHATPLRSDHRLGVVRTGRGWCCS